MIHIDSLTKGYLDGEERVEVLMNLTAEVPIGRAIAVTGASGSGKSTLLNLLAGVLVPDSGAITLQLDEHEYLLHTLGESQRTQLRRNHIGYVHQFFNLIPTLTVLENVMLPCQLNKLAGAKAIAERLLERVGLTHRLHAFPERLSGGEQQRVAVARALAISPALVLADEPTGNLDKANSESVSRLLFDAIREEGATLVVATHSEVVASLADQRMHLDGS